MTDATELDGWLGSKDRGSVRRNLQTALDQGLVPGPMDTNPQPITIPPPSVYPTNLGKNLRVEYLAQCYLEALRWTEAPSGEKVDLKSKRFEVIATLKKFESKANAIFDALEYVRDEHESRLSPPFWAWWRISSHIEFTEEKGKASIPGILTVFDPDKLLSKQLRGIFWRDGMDRAGEPQVMWPKDSVHVVRLWREFERDAMDNPKTEPEELARIWELCYSSSFDEWVASSRHQRFQIAQAVKKAHERNDLGLWLSDDLVGHLRLRRQATTTLVQE